MGALRGRVRCATPFLLLFMLCAGSAGALPITLYADATRGTGFAPADVASALAAGVVAPTPVAGLWDGAGSFVLTTSDEHPRGKDKRWHHPERGTSTWTLQVAAEAPVDLLQDVCVVILGHDPHDPNRRYSSGDVGLAFDGESRWLLVTPESGGPVFLAYRLGDLEPGGRYVIPIQYRVRSKLAKRRGVVAFPRYAVAYVSLPEPSAPLLCLAALAFALGARRKRRARDRGASAARGIAAQAPRADTLVAREGSARDEPSRPRDRVRQW